MNDPLAWGLAFLLGVIVGHASRCLEARWRGRSLPIRRSPTVEAPRTSPGGTGGLPCQTVLK
jgi:hypothetical protein